MILDIRSDRLVTDQYGKPIPGLTKCDCGAVWKAVTQDELDRDAEILGRAISENRLLRCQLGIERARLKAARGELESEAAKAVAELKDVVPEGVV